MSENGVIEKILSERRGEDAVRSVDEILSPILFSKPHELTQPEKYIAVIEELEKEVKTPKTPKLVRAQAPPPKEHKPLASTGVSVLKAPLPGTILQVLVKPGDAVKKEQNLLIMEAMKMENNILSEKDGTVKSVKVAPGDTVLQGDILLEIE